MIACEFETQYSCTSGATLPPGKEILILHFSLNFIQKHVGGLRLSGVGSVKQLPTTSEMNKNLQKVTRQNTLSPSDHDYEVTSSLRKMNTYVHGGARFVETEATN